MASAHIDSGDPRYREAVAPFGAGLKDVLETLLAAGDLVIGAPQATAIPLDEALAGAGGLAFPFNFEGSFELRGAILISGPVLPVLAAGLMGETDAPAELSELHLPALRHSLAGVCGRWAQSIEDGWGASLTCEADDTLDPRQPREVLSALGPDAAPYLLESYAISLGSADGVLALLLPQQSAAALIEHHPSSTPTEARPMATNQPPEEPMGAEAMESMMGGGQYAAPAPRPAAAMPDVNVSRPAFAQLTPRPNGSHESRGIDLILDVPLTISVELGRKDLNIREILDLVPGSLIELDKLAGEPLDLLINGKLFAKGEVVVIDENFGIRVTTIISPEERIQQLR